MTTAIFFHFLQRYRLLNTVALFCIVGGVGWLVLISPLVTATATSRFAVRTQVEVHERLAQERATFERTRLEIKKITDDEFQKIERIAPKGRDVPQLIVALEALASETGILLKDVSVANGATDADKQLPSGITPVDLVVTVTGGDYGTLKRFLESIEKNVRILDVKNFTFAKGLASYAIHLRAYYRE